LNWGVPPGTSRRGCSARRLEQQLILQPPWRADVGCVGRGLASASLRLLLTARSDVFWDCIAGWYQHNSIYMAWWKFMEAFMTDWAVGAELWAANRANCACP
jgi:hypothetical protein